VPTAAVLVTNLGAGRGRAPASAPSLSEKVVAIEVHHLVPGRHEVTHELLLRVVAGVDLRQRPELGVRTEDEVGRSSGPLDLARGAALASRYDLTRSIFTLR
jgi:hypothetical protein